MKRKKFCKMLMAAGISRNTATEAADAANRQGLSLFKVQGRILNMRYFFLWRLVGSRHMRKEFDKILWAQARMTPRRIRPLKAKRRHDGLRIDWHLVDEMAAYGGVRNGPRPVACH